MRFANLLGGFVLLGGFLVGCVSIDEPKGIQDIRSAKVDFLKAQTALQLAEAKLTEAKAATEAANAKLQESYAKAKDLQNAADEAKSEQDKARFELELKEMQANNQVTLLNLQTQVTNAQIAYQNALFELNILKTTTIPEEYMAKLDNIKNNLASVLYQITSTENSIISENLALNLYVAKDAVLYDYALKNRVAECTKNLQLAQSDLATLQQLKTTNQANADEQKTIINNKLTAINADLNSYNAQLDKLNITLADLGTQKSLSDFNLDINGNGKQDYNATIAIPSSIKTDIKNQFSYLGVFSSDLTSLSITASLTNLIIRLQTLKSFADSKKTQSDDWATLASNVNKIYELNTKTLKDLNDARIDLTNDIDTKNLQKQSLTSYISNLVGQKNTFNNLLTNLFSSLENNIKNATKNVSDLQVELNEANADLAAWQKDYSRNQNDPWSNYSNQKANMQLDITNLENNLKNLKDKFDALTKQKDELVKLINDYNNK